MLAWTCHRTGFAKQGDLPTALPVMGMRRRQQGEQGSHAGKGGRLAAQGRGALVSRVSVLAAGGRGEPFRRHETPLPYEAEKPLHQVHPQIWVSWGLLGYAGAALGQQGSSLGSGAGGVEH